MCSSARLPPPDEFQDWSTLSPDAQCVLLTRAAEALSASGTHPFSASSDAELVDQTAGLTLVMLPPRTPYDAVVLVARAPLTTAQGRALGLPVRTDGAAGRLTGVPLEALVQLWRQSPYRLADHEEIARLPVRGGAEPPLPEFVGVDYRALLVLSDGEVEKITTPVGWHERLPDDVGLRLALQLHGARRDPTAQPERHRRVRQPAPPQEPWSQAEFTYRVQHAVRFAESIVAGHRPFHVLEFNTPESEELEIIIDRTDFIESIDEDELADRIADLYRKAHPDRAEWVRFKGNYG
ncbi:MAG: hypothetical protein AAF368_00010 [Planctomycetota bacterium]